MNLCLESGRALARNRWAVPILILWLASAGAPALSAQTVAIEHDGVSCLVAGKFPLIDACFSPGDRVARARVYFRGDGVGDWYFVDMTPEESCYRGILPRPKSSLHTVSYYVATTDRGFAETRTREFGPAVVQSEDECSDGVVAPVVSSATVVVGALTGAAVPAGFVGGAVGLGLGTAAAVVGAGAVTGAVIAGGGEDATTTTTTVPGPTPTPTPRPTPTPSPTPSPTPTPTPPGACLPLDFAPPTVTILAPANNEDVGATVAITVDATDPGPESSGIDEVVLTAAEQGGSRTELIATLAGPGPTFTATWTVPACLGPQDRWYITARATDLCGRSKTDEVRVRRRGDTCALGPAVEASAVAVVWTSHLGVTAGRGQVVLDGTQALFPGPGRTELMVPAGPGEHRVEATLVSGRGPGEWRFELSAGRIRPGSLRVSAGDVSAIGPATVTFRLGGRVGERVVFTFAVDAAPPRPIGS